MASALFNTTLFKKFPFEGVFTDTRRKLCPPAASCHPENALLFRYSIPKGMIHIQSIINTLLHFLRWRGCARVILRKCHTYYTITIFAVLDRSVQGDIAWKITVVLGLQFRETSLFRQLHTVGTTHVRMEEFCKWWMASLKGFEILNGCFWLGTPPSV